MDQPPVSKTNILQLPEEILFKIMKLAGCCADPNNEVRLVCKRFYKVYCGFTLCGMTFNAKSVSKN